MTPKLKFTEGERVLCFHGPLIYEAKALKSTITKDKQVKYYIHYAGWNKNWDEWVPENRVLKYNEANVQRQKEVFKLHSNSAGKKKGTPKGKRTEANATATKDVGDKNVIVDSHSSSPSKELSTSLGISPSNNRSNRSKNTASLNLSVKEMEFTSKIDNEKDDNSKDELKEDCFKRKRGSSITCGSEKSTSLISTAASVSNCSTLITGNRSDVFVESEDNFHLKIEVKIKIPDELKQCLADDWDAITRQHKLLDIPAKISIQDIIEQYIAFKKNLKTTNTTKEVTISDVLCGVIEYFNVMVGSQLLYKFERSQYAEVLVKYPDVALSKLYGGFHLLRLFVKLGSMMAFSTLDEKTVQILLSHINDFLKFLVKNSATYFSINSFINVSPEYHRNTQ